MPDGRHAAGRRTAYGVAALLFCGLAGCNGGGPYPVGGRVEFEDGAPAAAMAGCTLTFTSEAVGKSAVGQVQPDGTFRLTTLRRNDGAFPGRYRVTVAQPHPNRERQQFDGPVVDLAYEAVGSTPLEATVEATDNFFTFKVSRFKARR